MDSRNLLILTVYLIIVTYVFYQAYKSLGGQVVIELDSADLNQQLREKALDEIVAVKFKFRDSYRLSELTKLPIVLKNKSQEHSISVDWNVSSIIDFDNVTGRVIRLTPGLTAIPQNQAVSILAPDQSIDEELTDDKDIAAPLFKPAKLKKAIDSGTPFYLRLFLTISNIVSTDLDKRSQILSCRLVPKKLSWTRALVIAMKPKPPKK
ncbi:MAG TPA: hypothetical protein V6D50_14655 [Chroococcales cyanobacterium]